MYSALIAALTAINLQPYSIYQTVQYFIRSKTGVLYVTVFKYSLRNFSVMAPLKIRTNFKDDVHFLHTFHLKFTVKDNFVYIPVEATFSTSTMCLYFSAVSLH